MRKILKLHLKWLHGYNRTVYFKSWNLSHTHLKHKYYVFLTALSLQCNWPSEESKGYHKPARFKEVHSKLHSWFVTGSFAVYTQSFSFNPDTRLYVHSAGGL